MFDKIKAFFKSDRSNLNLSVLQKEIKYIFYENSLPFFFIDSVFLQESIDYVKKKSIEYITIGAYYHLKDLNFLEELPFIKGIRILNDDILDISKISSLHDLEILHSPVIENQTIDLQNFPKLKSLNILWSSKIKNLSACNNLIEVNINYFNELDLSKFVEFKKLQYLVLTNATKITTLKGIGGLEELVEFQIEDAKKLVSFGDNLNKLKKIKKIYFWNSKKFNDYQQLIPLVNLENLQLRRTMDSESIDFIKNLINLKSVVLGFKVENGNMSYLEGIEDVGFIDFPHYSHKMKDFQNKSNKK